MHINLNAMGTRMKRRRKELKMSQAELAEKNKCFQQSYFFD